jgi:dipeptidyl aminopeptidase/acylaminoacyl peptidase
MKTYLLLLVLGTSVANLLLAQNSNERLTLERYVDYQPVSNPVIAPNGEYVAYEVSFLDPQQNYFWNSRLVLRSRAGDVVQQIVGASNPVWSPSGRELLYTTEEDDGVKFVVAAPPKFTPRVIANWGGPVMNPAWSPDEKLLAFSSEVDVAPPAPLYTLPASIISNTVTPEPFDTTELHHLRDGEGLRRDSAQQLFILKRDTGQVRALPQVKGRLGISDSATTMNPAVLSWASDSRSFYFDGNLNPDFAQQNNQSYIYRLDINTNQITTVIGPASNGVKGYFSEPAVSPDGRHLAFQGFFWQQPVVTQPEEIFTVNLDGFAVRQLTRLDAGRPDRFLWSADSRSIVLSQFNRGDHYLYQVNLQGQLLQQQSFVSGEQWRLASMDQSGNMLGIHSGLARLPAVSWRTSLKTGNMRVLANETAEGLNHPQFGAVERLQFRSTEGTDITGWLLMPPDFDPNKKYPLLLRPDAHADFSYELQNYAAVGHIVLIIHYRANQAGLGFGAKFMNHGFNGLFTAELTQDLLRGVEEVKQRPYIDTQRLRIVGSSQGGGVTAWLITQTPMFHAAVVHRPQFINPVSAALLTDEASWTFRLFAKPYWQDLMPWLQRSPVMQVQNVTTPTLVVCGEQDYRTPMSEAVQFYAGLHFANRTARRLIRMPEVAHGWGGDAATFMRLQGYTLGWLQQVNH